MKTTANYEKIIDNIIESMIVSQQRTFTCLEMGKRIRAFNSHLTSNQVQVALKKLKLDPRVTVKKVTPTKQYISYKGVC